jgi:hypothetical protein
MIGPGRSSAFRQVIWPQQSARMLAPGCRVKVPELRAVGWVPDGEVAAGRADDEQSVVGADLPGLVVLVWVYFEREACCEADDQLPAGERDLGGPLVEDRQERGNERVAV